jgi:hypothetical protein
VATIKSPAASTMFDEMPPTVIAESRLLSIVCALVADEFANPVGSTTTTEPAIGTFWNVEPVYSRTSPVAALATTTSERSVELNFSLR